MKNKQKMFVIRPVRGISEVYREGIEAQIKVLSLSYEIYDPLIHTDQNDTSGLRICEDNRKAIDESDIVAVMWDGVSTGCLFDLGMAFAMGKRIMPVTGYFPSLVNIPLGKSFIRMVWAWADSFFEEESDEN